MDLILLVVVEPAKDCRVGRDRAEFLVERERGLLIQVLQAGSGRGLGPHAKVKRGEMVNTFLLKGSSEETQQSL